ncbi:conserved hypothetical protein [Heliomicrobium modesticaldum Ice1]|uniref:PurE domain-containing protein n=1 Tax=Heliobacterium modesticaldum (strain ATCC 51547 / Ice1) TaxID=498761 RepID=B0TE14_HELMI|nr:nickel pincer cofactor biosynthesis protein LarB [Heliomicrobium modesticaldum]ABZ84209.1 conserved hypothetical protein [Heliomicrobium modesticaldum Ice1]
MDHSRLTHLLRAVQDGQMPVEEAVDRLKGWPYEDIGFAKVDHYRAIHQGFPEVIFGLGKRPEQTAVIFERLARTGLPVLATRCTAEAFAAVQAKVPEAVFHELAQVITLRVPEENERPIGTIAVVTAGTADLPVAEEAAVSALAMGCRVKRIFDVGVAGLHRLLSKRNELKEAQVIVVIAGMEGALASVVAGMVDIPVVAVPTSIGYGANFGGLSALLGMLNSCALGVGVVNIDNGFGAAALAATIVRSGSREAGRFHDV